MSNPTIQIDTRQAEGKHSLKHGYFASMGFHCIRSKLYVGDYMFVGGTTSVDSKASIQEVSLNIDHDHLRFRREMVNAAEAGISLVVLIENRHHVESISDLAGWRESTEEFVRRRHAQRRLEGMRLAKAMKTMRERYGVSWAFCSPEDAGRAVVEILRGEGTWLDQS